MTTKRTARKKKIAQSAGLTPTIIALFFGLSAIKSVNAKVNIDVIANPQTIPIYTGPLEPNEPEQEPELPPLMSAKSAIVIDQASGEVLGALLPDIRRPMASTTKIMTALLVLEAIANGSLDLTTIVSVSVNAGTMGDDGMGLRSEGSIMGDLAEDPNDAGQNLSLGLSPGDSVSIQDLLYGALLDSGNDAAIALAEAVSGSESAFVAKMNQRASQLGLHNTWFANPHGRDPNRISDCPIVGLVPHPCAHYSSTRDLATLTRIALDIPVFAMIVSTQNYEAASWSARFSNRVDSSMDTSNQFLRTGSSFYNPAVFGVKTGTTGRAGRCLVSAADSTRNTRDSVIAVILGASGEEDDAAFRYTDSELVLNHGLRVLELLSQPSLPTHITEAM